MTRESKIDYANRTVDLLLLKTVLAPVDSVVNPDVSGTPMMVTGIEKLVQRYAQLFLTSIGSVKNRDGEGTEFMPKMRSGRIYDENTLKSAAAEANSFVSRQIKISDRDTDMPDDEALDVADVISVSISRQEAKMTVSVRLTTKSGDSFTFITPVDIGA